MAKLPVESGGKDSIASFAGRTVFYGRSRVDSRLGESPATTSVALPSPETSSDARAATLRREAQAAPWVEDEAVARTAGDILRRLDPMAVTSGIGEEELHLYDRVAVRAPVGLTLAAGDELVAVSVDASLSGGGRVFSPRGVLRVARVDAGAGEAMATVVAKYGRLVSGTMLLPAAAPSVAPNPAPVSTERSDAEGAVVAVVDGAMLPTLQHVVLLDVGAPRGVRAGDEVLFFADAASRSRGRSAEAVARGTVLRATPRGSSVLIVRQSQPSLGEGTLARVRVGSAS